MNITKKHSAEVIPWALTGALFIYACIILALSPGTFDAGDGLSHYFISRYSWHHHYLFLDDWGKPFFTIISSPFAQFGLKGITLFNILCGLGASYITYKIAEKLTIPFPYLAIIFTFSAPIYFGVINSGLTEPLFTFMLMACIWLAMNERYYMSAIVFSFLPFVRPEYIFILPLFLFYYILKRKYLANFLLPAGTLVISAIGFFYYKRFFWLISQNPYSETNSKSYGDVKGDMFSYIGNYQHITGIALLILIIAGLVWFGGGRLLKKSNTPSAKDYHTEEVLLIYGSFIFILVGHTLVWATGTFPTLGLYRYMATLIPLAALISLRGLQLINFIPATFRIPYLKTIIAVGFSAAVLYSPYTMWYKVPFGLSVEDVVLKEATDWLKQTPDATKKVFYLAPYITQCMNLDPYDTARLGLLWSMNSQRPDLNMPHGSIMIWDSHFGANEGRMKLDTLLKNPNLTLLRRFDPAQPFRVIGGMNYGVWIFQKK